MEETVGRASVALVEREGTIETDEVRVIDGELLVDGVVDSVPEFDELSVNVDVCFGDEEVEGL